MKPTQQYINLWIKTDEMVNNEFLRFSITEINKYNSYGSLFSILFRIESKGIDVSNTINSILQDNLDRIDSVSISDYRKLREDGVYEDVYRIDNNKIYQIPIQEYIKKYSTKCIY